MEELTYDVGFENHDRSPAAAARDRLVSLRRVDAMTLLGIIAVGLIARLVFAVGFVGGYPQDDGIYITLGRSISQGSLDLGHYRTIAADYVANPADTFTFRSGYIYPLGLCFRFFGEGDWAAIWPALIPSLFGIAITATLASELFGRTAGLFAALLLATLPNDILSSTRILADAPLGAWTSGAILALLIGWNSGHLASFALCGLMLGIAYLVKDTGLVVFVLLAPLVLAYAMVTRRWRLLGGYLTGFLLCIVLEGLWYQFHTGHFFLHPLVAHSVTVHKYTKEPVASLVTLPFLRVDWVEQFFLIGPVLFGFAKETPYRFSGFGVTYWLIGAGFVWCASRSSDRRVQVLLALVAVIYLYLEFGPVGVTLEDGVLVYRGIYKHLRYASVLTPLAMPFAGLVLALLWARHRGVAIAATVAVIASGVPSLLHDYTVLRASQHDLRVAATFLTPLNATVYTDYLAAGSLRYHSGNHAGGMRIRDIREIQNPSDLRDSFVVLGGSRGIEVLSEYALQVIPSWARSISERPESALPTWHRLLTLEGPKDDRRRYDMVIFKVE